MDIKIKINNKIVRKVYRRLTKQQKESGVIFTSTLSKNTIEMSDDTTHIVRESDNDKYDVIERLKDDKFFRGSVWSYNIIRN